MSLEVSESHVPDSFGSNTIIVLRHIRTQSIVLLFLLIVFPVGLSESEVVSFYSGIRSLSKPNVRVPSSSSVSHWAAFSVPVLSLPIE